MQAISYSVSIGYTTHLETNKVKAQGKSAVIFLLLGEDSQQHNPCSLRDILSKGCHCVCSSDRKEQRKDRCAQGA